jgi:predicted PurR-regulated permease PerM
MLRNGLPTNILELLVFSTVAALTVLYALQGRFLLVVVALCTVVMLWQTKSRHGYMPTTLGGVILVAFLAVVLFAFTLATFSSQLSNSLKPAPMWTISAQGNRTADCDQLLSPVPDKPFQELDFNSTTQVTNKIMSEADALLAKTVTRPGTIGDPYYAFLGYRLVSAIFPDNRGWGMNPPERKSQFG